MRPGLSCLGMAVDIRLVLLCQVMLSSFLECQVLAVVERLGLFCCVEFSPVELSWVKFWQSWYGVK